MPNIGTTQRIGVKICCIATLEEARTAVASGAAAIGLVSVMPSGPGVISEVQIREISEEMSSQVDTFLLTARTDPAEIIRQHRRCATRTIQLVDTLSSASRAQIKSAIPDVQLVQVVHVVDENSIAEALNEQRPGGFSYRSAGRAGSLQCRQDERSVEFA